MARTSDEKPKKQGSKAKEADSTDSAKRGKKASDAQQTKNPKKTGKPDKGKRPGAKSKREPSAVPNTKDNNKQTPKRASKRKERKKEAREDKKKSKNKEPRKPLTILQVVGRVLPVICLALAFVAVVILYRRLMPQKIDGANDVVQAMPSDQPVAPEDTQSAYAGLEDRWLVSGLFTTGDKELDMQVKEFCDALTIEGASARDNANKVYNTIVWSPFEERGANEAPSGSEWAVKSAKRYFETGSPADGIPGSGDVYDFVATINYCMRYFGFYDSLAVPIVKGSPAMGQTSSALVLVSNEYGMPCVCDPTLAAEGFLLDRNLYTITVEDIGQDLTAVEALGLNVQRAEEVSNQTSVGGPSGNVGVDQTTESVTSQTDIDESMDEGL